MVQFEFSCDHRFRFTDTSCSPDQKGLEDEWQTGKQIKTHPIYQQEIDELKSLELEDSKLWVTKELELEELTAGAKKSMSVQQMDGSDTETLVQIVANIPNLTDESVRGWRTLLQEADLGKITSEIDLKGPARTIAWGLVDFLKRRARLPERPDCEVLGLLLCYILAMEDLPPTDSTRIKDIIGKYGLAPLS